MLQLWEGEAGKAGVGNNVQIPPVQTQDVGVGGMENDMAKLNQSKGQRCHCLLLSTRNIGKSVNGIKHGVAARFPRELSGRRFQALVKFWFSKTLWAGISEDGRKETATSLPLGLLGADHHPEREGHGSQASL